MMSRLILICSGATEALRKARFAGDEPLEPKTQAQAAAMAGDLPRADRHWCSPALRARQTAEALGLHPEIADALRDQSAGAWAGKTLTEVEALDPSALIAWITDPAAAAPGGESVQDVAARMAGVLAELLANPGTVMAVTHPAVIRVTAALVLDAPLQSAGKIDLEPLSLTDLRSDGRRWHLRALGAPLR
jgi:broad specificity phosphatase PhoE